MALVRAMGGKPTDLITKNIIENGIYNASGDGADGYSSVSVQVPTIEGVIFGNDIPNFDIGINGDYYYLQSHLGVVGASGWTYGSSGQSKGGYKFTPIDDIVISAIRTYSRNSSNITGIVGLYDPTGNIIYESPTVTLTPGWNIIYIPNIGLLTNNQYCVISTFNTSNSMIYSTIGDMSFSSHISNIIGMYGSFPGTNDYNNVYSTDIVISDDTKPLYISKQYIKDNDIWLPIETGLIS